MADTLAGKILDPLLDIIPQKALEQFLEYNLIRRPISVSIELVNTCNADCTFCAYRYQKRPKGIISDEIFKRAVDQYCAIGGGKLELTPTVGEPLIDPHLLKRIRYARRKDEIREIGFFSNLLLLHRFNIKEFLTSGITHIRISACIKNEETYRRIYQAEGYPQLLKNIVSLCETNRALNSPARIELFLRVPKPHDEVRESKDFQTIAPYFDPKDISFEDDEYDSWSGQIKNSELPDGNHFQRNPYKLSDGPCEELYRKMFVLYDGRVNFCICRDLNAENIIGNIMEKNLLEIWMGHELKKFREDWLNGIYPKMCISCERYMPYKVYQNQNRLQILKKYLQDVRFQLTSKFRGSNQVPQDLEPSKNPILEEAVSV